MTKTRAAKLTEALLKRKLITHDKLQKLIALQRNKSHNTILETLTHENDLSAETLMEVVSSELDITPISLSRCKLHKETVQLIPKKIAETYTVVAISSIGDVINVAMADPLNVIAVDDIRHETGRVVMSLMASRTEIHEAIEHFYGEDTSQAIQDIVQGMEESSLIVLESNDEASKDSQELLKLTQEEPVVRLTNSLLVEGVRRHSSDIFVEPHERSLGIRYRVDGILQDGPHPPKSMHTGIVSRIKIISGLDIAEHRLPQDGRLKLRINERNIDFRVSTVPSYFGEKICIRILDPGQANLDIEKLGYDDSTKTKLLKAASRPHGMILICGPTGSGKTTTLYAILNQLNQVEKNLVTIEDPVEYHIHGINQVHTRPEVKLTFASALRSILRQDPDVILVGEIRDAETADVGVKAALTGHLVLSTLHTNTAIGSITRLVNMGIEPFLITSSVVLVGSQRLARKLCMKCRTEYVASEEVKKSLRVRKSGEVKLFRSKGCDKCHMTGYSGRISVIEVLPLTTPIRQLVVKRASEDEIKRQARKEGMQTLRENALLKAYDGLTSAEEVLRVTAGDL